MRTVSYYRRDQLWMVLGSERRSGPNGELVLSRAELCEAMVVDVKRALASQTRGGETGPSDVAVSDSPPDNLDPDYGAGPVGLELRGGTMLVTVLHFAAWPEDGLEETLIEKLGVLIRPLLAHRRASLHSIEAHHDYSDDMTMCVLIRLSAPWRGQSVQVLVGVGDDVLALCDAYNARGIDRESVADLVRGGCAELLIGRPEGNWLDAKAEEYDLTTTSGKISLAQAVARFCNGDEGGLIVIGATAKKIPGGEVIRQVRGVTPRQKDTSARYLRILDQHLYPPATGLRIDVVPITDQRALISVDIPVQPEESKPFLVHGAITADRATEGSFISIVQRRGEGSIPITAPMIHASLAAGRALLRGQVPPPRR